MARGDIHTQTGTVCKAETDASCPLGGGDGKGHVADLTDFAEHHGVDPGTLKQMVIEGHMNPRAVVDLMGEGHEATPPPLTKAPYVPPTERATAVATPAPAAAADPNETPQQRYDREMAKYVLDLKAYEDHQINEYERQLAKRDQWAPAPVPPPLRTVYPKSFERYAGEVTDFLPDEPPADIPAYEAQHWQEYHRKRKQLGDLSKEPLYYT